MSDIARGHAAGDGELPAAQFHFELQGALPRMAAGAGGRLRLGPGLAFSEAASSAAQVTLLGDALDPLDCARSNADIAAALAAAAHSFDAFESAAHALGGRWIAIVRIGGAARVYLDACGSRPVYWVRLAAGQIALASQPGLLAALHDVERLPSLDAEFRQFRRFANSWPLELTPYRGVQALLPNHCLDLVEGSVHRVWPRTPLQPVAEEDAADEIARLLRGTIDALRLRGSLALALTAGHDSRTLYAAATCRPTTAACRMRWCAASAAA